MLQDGESTEVSLNVWALITKGSELLETVDTTQIYGHVTKTYSIEMK